MTLSSTRENCYNIPEAEALGQAVQRRLDEGKREVPRPTAPCDFCAHFESARFEERSQAAPREQVQVIVDRAPPLGPEEPRLEAVRVRSRQRKDAAGSEDSHGLVEENGWRIQVLDEVGSVHEVEASPPGRPLLRACRRRLAGRSGRSVARLGGGDLDALGLPSLFAQGREEGSSGAADVQDARLPALGCCAIEDARGGPIEAEVGQAEQLEVAIGVLVRLFVSQVLAPTSS